MGDPKDTRYTEKGDHRVWHDGDRNVRMSWDSDHKGDYVPGSGHETDQSTGEVTADWDKSD